MFSACPRSSHSQFRDLLARKTRSELGIVNCKHEGTAFHRVPDCHSLRGTSNQTAGLAPHPDQHKNWLEAVSVCSHRGEKKQNLKEVMPLSIL